MTVTGGPVGLVRGWLEGEVDGWSCIRRRDAWF